MCTSADENWDPGCGQCEACRGAADHLAGLAPGQPTPTPLPTVESSESCGVTAPHGFEVNKDVVASAWMELMGAAHQQGTCIHM